MSDHEESKKPLELAEEVQDMKIKEEEGAGPGTVDREQPADARRSLADIFADDLDPTQTNETLTPMELGKLSASQSPTKAASIPQSPAVKAEHEEIVGGDITVKIEPGQAPKLSRSSAKKIISRPPPLFLDYADATADACRTFEQISDCMYERKSLGSTDHALECDCTEEWDASTRTNNACGDDSDCINRATKMECIGDCNCGVGCQNQRFQQREYAKVSVIKTEKKGFGLRADAILRPHQFIYEYIGEVISEGPFRRRMVQYDEEGIKHFYFMSLNKGEFVDATKKGNLGRFCNHSCNPNCYVDKWVVGEKLRMGIFASRKIARGEELVFNYNVDRYGADPQPCYCGEPNCTGYIGGKTQTERSTKLSALTIEALGIDDGDGWDTAVAKKPRKKKADEEDEEYVDSVQPKSLDEGGVTKVMATLMQCKEKWIAVKLLNRIQRCDDERVVNRVVKMHGYQILNSALTTWAEDNNVVLQVLEVLEKLPKLTRNKIQDSKIEATIEKLTASEHEEVKERSTAILKVWSALEVGYRIPRMKRDPNAVAAVTDRAEKEERRRTGRDRSRSRSLSPSVPKGPSAVPTGPRNSAPQRNFQNRPPQFRRNFPAALPAGWFSAQSNGKTYYYSASGQTTWTRPTAPASQPPPPPREKTNEQRLQDIINSITKTSTPKEKPSATASPQTSSSNRDPPVVKHVHKEKREKWRTYSEEKKMKLYENTLFPHVKYVMDKFRGKLPKDDLKRFAKEVSKKIVSSDFKNRRVEDPSKISAKQEKQVKKYVKDYFDKAVSKKGEHDRKKAERKAQDAAKQARSGSSSNVAKHSLSTTPPGSPPVGLNSFGLREPDEDIVLSENEIEDDDDDEPSTSPEGISPDTDLKRKRGDEAEETPLTGVSPGEDYGTPSKKVRSEASPVRPPTPPPPPPPPETPDLREGHDEDEEMDGDTGEQDGHGHLNAYGHPLQQLENGLSAEDDVSGSFTNEALSAVMRKPIVIHDEGPEAEHMVITPTGAAHNVDAAYKLRNGIGAGSQHVNGVLLDELEDRDSETTGEAANGLKHGTRRLQVEQQS